MYGQPSWWGWESSDDEFYTYPNSATVVTQAGTLAIPTQNCTVLQSRIHRNKARIEHSLRSGSGTKDGMFSKRHDEDSEFLKERSQSLYSQSTVPLSRNGLKQLSHPVHNVPTFGAWEAVPQGSFDEGPEDLGLDGDEKLLRTSLSYHIPLMPEFGEIPEEPVSDKSGKTARRKSNKKQLPSGMFLTRNKINNTWETLIHWLSGGFPPKPAQMYIYASCLIKVIEMGSHL